MRIPSQFNDSSLYRSRNTRGSRRPPPHNDARRRLIRLSVALLLVIVVMRQAAKPGVYQAFFANSSDTGWVPADEPENIPPPPERPESLVEAAGRSETAEDSFTDDFVATNIVTGEASSDRPTGETRPERETEQRHLMVRWGNVMEVPLQRAWTQTLLQLSRDHLGQRPESLSENGIALTVDQLDRSVSLLRQAGEEIDDGETAIPTTATEALKDTVLGDLKRLRDAADQRTGADMEWSSIRPWAEPLLETLDRAALKRVVDGTFWVGPDSDAFYLMLARAGEIASEVQRGTRDRAVSTGTVPLLQQPDVYRGRTIRVVGKLQLAEPKTAAENRAGIKSYWKLWVIPNDGGIRPTVLITPELPDSVRSSLSSDGTWDRQASAANPGGQIAAVGRFIKRLPYRSKIGADLAPVVIGDIVAVKGIAKPARPPAAEPAAAAPGGEGIVQIAGIVAAMLIGVAVAVVLMHRSNKEINRTRRMRRAVALPPTPPFDDLPRDDFPKGTP